ncbi:MAG: hypothetical protein B9S37_04235 [Verrucomicrobiia bacterium Tous-C3TDCM]|nr:MAG: hypothetical protein B9S37_04235 [Verrucomicrobiae bacterium Tous-C3TDCM]
MNRWCKFFDMTAEPLNHPHVRYVNSIAELVCTPMCAGVNALCLRRSLDGDFTEVIRHLRAERGITTLDRDQLLALRVSDAGKIAIETMLRDQEELRAYGFDPEIDCVNGYIGHDQQELMRTDVCSFHIDRATDIADTYLCTYAGASSIGVCHEDVILRAQVPAVRARLLADFGGADDESFLDYLRGNYYDMHYEALPAARTFSFGVGHLWRIAIDYPGTAVPPCIHRAPDPVDGEPPRLILIG